MGTVRLGPKGEVEWIALPPTAAETAEADAAVMKVAEALGRLMAALEVERMKAEWRTVKLKP